MMNYNKSIFINNINNFIFFRANSRTSKGMSLSYGPYFFKDADEAKTILGEQILKTFEECKIDLPHPEDLTKQSLLEKQDPYSTSEEATLLKKLKKTFKDLRLSITYDGKQFIFRPHKVINKEYSEGIDCEPLTCDNNPENLGKTLIKAFELCK